MQKETGVKFHTNVYEDIFGRIFAHRKAMGLKIPEDWKIEVEQQLCQRVPKGWCLGQETGGGSQGTVDPGGKIGFREALSGTATLVDFFLSGSKRVPAEEAEGRAAICVECPKNVPLAECSTCNTAEIRDIITKVVEGGKTSVDAKLHVCAVCSCSNQAAVWMPLEVMHIAAEVDARLPGFCWKKSVRVKEGTKETEATKGTKAKKNSAAAKPTKPESRNGAAVAAKK